MNVAASFGQLNWNISRDVTKSLYQVTSYLNSVGLFYEITVIIFFVVNIFNKNSYFRRPYFVILTIGCIVNALLKFVTFADSVIRGNQVLYYLIYVSTWYNENFITLCNLVLALNRFSAIVFPLYFSRIWSKRNSTIICIFLIIYPFLIHCFNPMYIYYTITRQQLTISVQQTQFEYVFSYVSDFTYAVLATSAGIIAAINLILKGKTKDKNVERVLLIQSIASSVFLIVSTVSAWLASVNKYTPDVTFMPEILRLIALQSFFLSFSVLFYSFHHYIGLILLIIMSENFRSKYLNFYQINYLLPKCYNKVTPQPNMTTTVVLLSDRPNTF